VPVVDKESLVEQVWEDSPLGQTSSSWLTLKVAVDSCWAV